MRLNPYLVKLVLINSGWKSCFDKQANAYNLDADHHMLNLPKADLYLDCRVLPNPVFIDGIGSTGDDPKMQQWMITNGAPFIESFTQLIEDGIHQIPKRRSGKEDPWEEPYRICFMCAHGIHRSRSMKHLMGQRLKGYGYNVEVK
jgi:RNase adaptor protein for sRNA GlmZ degradation